MAFAEDLSVFLVDWDTTVSFSGSVAGMLGIMDLAGLEVLGDAGRAIVSAANRTVLIRTDQKGALTQGSAITVASVAYTVRDLVPIEDGAFTLVTLR